MAIPSVPLASGEATLMGGAYRGARQQRVDQVFRPKVSIVIPVFNGVNFLREAIRSALAQTYDNLEIIVVNDGSNDGGATERLVSEFGDRIRYFTKPNGGVATALNRGIAEMSGDYFSWLSHDDLYLPDKLRLQVAALAQMPNPERCVFYSDFALFSVDPEAATPSRLPHIAPADFRYFITTASAVHGCTLLIPRQAFDEHGGFDPALRTTQDYDLWFRMAATFAFVHQPLILLRARGHPAQGTQALSDLVRRECDTMLTGFVEKLSESEIRRNTLDSLAGGYLQLARNLEGRGFFGAAKRGLELSQQSVPAGPRYGEPPAVVIPRRLLFVCMQHSPHAVRWINNLAGRGWDLHLFAMNYEPELPTLRGVTVHRPFLRVRRGRMLSAPRTSVKNWWDGLVAAEVAAHPQRLLQEPVYPLPMAFKMQYALDRLQLRTGESDATSPLFFGPRTLVRVIRKLKPDLIHSMEFQHCAYNVLRARELHGPDFPPWLATNWGSDIYHFRKDPAHLAQIQRLLRAIDFYSCECHRDIALARQLGMTAKALPVMPNSGGFDLASIARLRAEVPPSRRRVIMVKGYQHFAGRALTALGALERCADIVKDFEVVIFSASIETRQRAEQLRAETPVKNITILPHASHDEMLRMHARARLYLGVSVSDAISTSALEAMAMGAFPIQTDTSCCDEWFEHGKGGYLIPVDDVSVIAERVYAALTDDSLVDQAAAINWPVIAARLDERSLQQRVWAFYDEAFDELSPAAAS